MGKNKSKPQLSHHLEKEMSSVENLHSTAPEQNRNPLTIDLILIKIITFTTEDCKRPRKEEIVALKKLRLVSRHWNSIVSKIIRDTPGLYREVYFRDPAEVRNFTNMMKGNQNPTYCRFEINGNILKNSKLCFNFFDTCGWSMKGLKLNLGYGLLKEPIKNENLDTLNFPELQAFEYAYSTGYQKRYSEAEEIETHKLFAAIILKTSGQLKYLKCQIYAQEVPDFYNHLEFPPKIICRPILEWTALEQLTLGIGLNDTFLTDLTKSSLKPRDLHLHIHNCGTNFTLQTFTEFLTSQSKNLVNLDILEQSWRYTIKFPKMEALRSIHFNDAYALSSREYIRFDQFDYAVHLPAISKVKLSTHSNEDDWLPFFSSKSSSMQSMHLPITTFTNLNLAGSLHSLFPNLTELCVGLGSSSKYHKVLETIFATMLKLKSLKIYGFVRFADVQIDHILTGFSKDDCQRIRRERLFLNPENVIDIPRNPSLKDLTKLERFELDRQPPMDFLRESSPYFVSDVTGYLAFLQMENLKRIKIIKFGMTETCINLLKDRFHLEIEIIQRYIDGKYRPADRVFSYDDYDNL